MYVRISWACPRARSSVAQGQDIWEAKCAVVMARLANPNEVFTPIVGGTTAEDIATGRVASLTDTKQPQRTT